MAKKYIVRLTEEERTDLESLIHKGKVAAHKRLHAEILLKADVSELGERWQDKQISETFGISTRTVERVRARLVQDGLESALNRAEPTRARKRKIDGENEAHLIALMCGDAPEVAAGHYACLDSTGWNWAMLKALPTKRFVRR